MQMLGHTQRIGLQEMLDMADLLPRIVTKKRLDFVALVKCLERLDDPNPILICDWI